MSDEDRIVSIRTLVQGDSLVQIQIHRYRCTCLACTYSEHPNGHNWKIFELSSVYHLLTKGEAYEKVLQCQGLLRGQTAHQMQPGCHIPIRESQRNLVLPNIKCPYGRHRPCKQAIPFYSAGKGGGSHSAGQVSVSVLVCCCVISISLQPPSAAELTRLLWLQQELGQTSLTDTQTLEAECLNPQAKCHFCSSFTHRFSS